MFTIVGLISCISTVILAPVNITKNTSYILATALFYKDASGRVMLANGPVPEDAAMAISADVSSRFNNATVKVVPAFKQPDTLLNSSNIIDTIKNKYKTVFAIEVQKRLSRNAIVDWWNNLFHKTQARSGKKKRSTEIKEFMETTTEVNFTSTTPLKPTESETSPPSEEVSPSETLDYKSETSPPSEEDSPEITTKKPKTKKKNSFKKKKASHEVFSEEEDRFREFFQGNEHSGEKNDPKRLRYFDQFVPNDIYYSVEKNCVNWSEGCSHHAGMVPNTSNLYISYIKPNFPALQID